MNSKLGLKARLFCECLAANPGLTTSQMAVQMGADIDSTNRLSKQLTDDGYVARGPRNKAGYELTLTGKPFPPSSAWRPNADAARQERIDEEAIAIVQFVVPAFNAMCRVGRVAA
ncbi:hypothetical protein [Burkholderia gladioli]|uniref:hypothetical protein n=1 Tax=Burkholderia gladioli TaxID=28095 RepID=UPI0016419911|nr:hypothetical protein [Burkholderia gladioli]